MLLREDERKEPVALLLQHMDGRWSGMKLARDNAVASLLHEEMSNEDDGRWSECLVSLTLSRRDKELIKCGR